jgi:hypothetical protein
MVGGWDKQTPFRAYLHTLPAHCSEPLNQKVFPAGPHRKEEGEATTQEQAVVEEFWEKVKKEEGDKTEKTSATKKGDQKRNATTV